MKLAQLYNRSSIIITVGILLIAGIVYYMAISFISDRQLDRDLTEEIDELHAYISSKQQLPKPVDFDEDQASFTPIGQQIIKRRFVDTPFVERQSAKTEEGRAVVDMVRLHGINYKIVIAESKEGTENLIQIISIITAVLGLLFIVALIVTNRYLLAGLWRPFYDLLAQLHSFQLSGTTNKQIIGNIKAEEFKALQSAIEGMSIKAQYDYQSLKIFTENASHEMMTPIAVMTSKLDNLIQDESLSGAQYEQLQDLYNASSKLARINQALLLLVKIDNHLINDTVELNLEVLILQKCSQFTEITQSKDITVTHDLQYKRVKGSAYLLEVLIDNLFSNAIRHNIRGGQIYIHLDQSRLVFKNTGYAGPLDGDKIFERFNKSKTSDGTGLGLTIARNICANYGFTLSYEFQQPFHMFIITF